MYADAVLLDAATQVFRERGFHDASMVEMAARAGATKPTLYARFGSKGQVYDRVMERASDGLLAAMRDGMAGVPAGTAENATLQPVQAFFAWVRADPDGFQLLFGHGYGVPTGVDHRALALGQLTKMVAALNADYLRERELRAGRATGLIAASVVGLLHAAALWAVETRAIDRMDVASFVATFVLSGLTGVSPAAAQTLRRPPQ